MGETEALEGRDLPKASPGPSPSSSSWKPLHLGREEPTPAPDLEQEGRARRPAEASSQPGLVSWLQARQGLAPRALNVPPLTILSGQICKWPSGQQRRA